MMEKDLLLFGFQHQNENLLRDSFLGTLSPVTGAMITEDNAVIFIQVFKLNIK